MKRLGYQLFEPVEKVGPLDVTVTIVGYKEVVLKDLQLDSQLMLNGKSSSSSGSAVEVNDSKLSYTVELVLVNDVDVDPGKHSLYNHQKNKVVYLLNTYCLPIANTTFHFLSFGLKLTSLLTSISLLDSMTYLSRLLSFLFCFKIFSILLITTTLICFNAFFVIR